MHSALFSSAAIAEFYRFAVLLAGNAKTAEHAMAGTLAEADGQCGQMRSEKGRQAWFIGSLRLRCRSGAPDSAAAPRLIREDAENRELLDIEAFLLAQRFHGLPEPERSALALFYLDSFSIAEIAQFLKMDLEQLGETLGHARELLGESLRDSPEPATL